MESVIQPHWQRRKDGGDMHLYLYKHAEWLAQQSVCGRVNSHAKDVVVYTTDGGTQKCGECLRRSGWVAEQYGKMLDKRKESAERK